MPGTAPARLPGERPQMSSADKKVLVTGATGKTGSRLVKLLQGGGRDYIAASRHPADDPRVCSSIGRRLAPTTRR
jgi:nucleoside-diphosphate-sugar epimerase